MLEAKAGNEQLLVDSGDYVQVSLYVDGAAADATGTPTVTITRADGTMVVTAQATTEPTETTGVYRFTLTPTQLADLDELTAVWSFTIGGVAQQVTTRHQVVGGFYVTLADLRAQPNLTDADKMPISRLVAARRWFEDLAERYCGVAFVPRFARIRLSGGASSLLLPERLTRVVRAVWSYSDADTYEVFSVDDLAAIHVDSAGILWRGSSGVWPAGHRNLLVAYEHGYDAVPADVRDAAGIAIRDKILNDNVGRPMLSIADGAGGTTRFSTAGMGRPTGIPDVDAVLNAYRSPVCA